MFLCNLLSNGWKSALEQYILWVPQDIGKETQTYFVNLISQTRSSHLWVGLWVRFPLLWTFYTHCSTEDKGTDASQRGRKSGRGSFAHEHQEACSGAKSRGAQMWVVIFQSHIKALGDDATFWASFFHFCWTCHVIAVRWFSKGIHCIIQPATNDIDLAPCLLKVFKISGCQAFVSEVPWVVTLSDMCEPGPQEFVPFLVDSGLLCLISLLGLGNEKIAGL